MKKSSLLAEYLEIFSDRFVALVVALPVIGQFFLSYGEQKS